MPLPDDNDFPPPRHAGREGRRESGRAAWDALIAVLGGNALYFLFLNPQLPPPWQHQPFALDRGLGLDFLLCLVLFALLRLARAFV